MRVSAAGFAAAERIVIASGDAVGAGRAYGRATADPARRLVSPGERVSPRAMAAAGRRAETGLATLRQLAQGETFVVDGTNHLKEYVETLDGYAEGAGLSLTAAALLQSESVPACQTVVIGDGQGCTGVLHIEENVDDDNLPALHRSSETGYRPPEDGFVRSPSYDYRLVDWRVGNRRSEFFGYPGICSGGPAMGINRTTDLLMFVDALGPVTAVPDDALWPNAVAAVLFSVGTFSGVREIVRRLGDFRMAFAGGYAVHLVDGSGQMLSVEFGDRTIALVEPDRTTAGRVWVAQTNYPRLAKLAAIDKYAPVQPSGDGKTAHDIQLGLSARGRTDRLGAFARSAVLPFPFVADTLDALERLAADPAGDLECTSSGYVFNGFVTPYVAGYAVAAVSPAGGEIRFAKLAPPSIPDRPYHRWLPRASPVPAGVRDLMAEAEKQKASPKEP
jgi:hypothetical protein